MRVCYFIQSHRDPEQIYRLVRTLRRGSPHSHILVQHNPAACELDWQPIQDLPGVHRLDVPWRQVRANYNCQVEPYLFAVDWLDRSGLDYDWLVNLTAQDYPVREIAQAEAFLRDADCDGFLRYWDVLSAGSPWSARKARARYWHKYWRLPAPAEPWLRAIRAVTKILPLHFYLDYGPLVGLRRLRSPFGPDLRCQGGWAWFSLRRRAVRYLRDELRSRPDLVRHYRGTVSPEESLVQTILVNAGEFKLCDDDLRYIDYRGAVKGSPRTLGADDFELLAAGPFHYARKFDLAVDATILDRIDRELLFA